ncbi:hypothetical protein [Brevibacterium aurantiacum]|uniref:Uncharacterized protein n=1 Tax=Brevibacterium aurantiacum TaxID=273384 RepID=A0A3Q9NXD3_BREAU|nr:hypothetical protein [Brevibacterium aurantiacum]AZT94877.1 hypothetical protein CXR23_18450 [Brevibacterium aurantiacum]MDN5585719.1 hypothetical protein [Brevibacterium sp.]
MATDYSPEHIAMMAEEFAAAARALGITLPSADEEPGGESGRASRSHSGASDLVVALLEASSGWAAVSGSRASGPFGAFLAGSHPDASTGAANSACAHIGGIICVLSRAGG